MVIVDSSTLIHLSAIGRIGLLKELYGQLTVTPGVWREVVDQGQGRTGVADMEAARQHGWLEVRTPANQPLLQSLRVGAVAQSGSVSDTAPHSPATGGSPDPIPI
jgi:predicted nucleic acid-binding protein